jgi:hypothetical protein
MRNSKGVKGILIKKLGEVFISKVSLVQFNEAFLFLDCYNRTVKIVPYGLFEKNFDLDVLKSTDAGVIFYRWLSKKTGNIEKDFNKSRKLVRLFKDIVDEYDRTLVYNLSVSDIFVIPLVAFFTEYTSDKLPFTLPILDADVLNKTLDELRQYLSAIFFIDMISDTSEMEQVISIFINEDDNSLLQKLVNVGLELTAK